MGLFMFVISGVPSPDNAECSHLACALIHVWVVASDINNAKEKAFDYIRAYQWIPEHVEHEFVIQPTQIPELGASESRLYRAALQYGIAADFVASPKQQGKPGDPVEMRRMKKPPQ